MATISDLPVEILHQIILHVLNIPLENAKADDLPVITTLARPNIELDVHGDMWSLMQCSLFRNIMKSVLVEDTMLTLYGVDELAWFASLSSLGGKLERQRNLTIHASTFGPPFSLDYIQQYLHSLPPNLRRLKLLLPFGTGSHDGTLARCEQLRELCLILQDDALPVDLLLKASWPQLRRLCLDVYVPPSASGDMLAKALSAESLPRLESLSLCLSFRGDAETALPPKAFSTMNPLKELIWYPDYAPIVELMIEEHDVPMAIMGLMMTTIIRYVDRRFPNIAPDNAWSIFYARDLPLILRPEYIRAILDRHGESLEAIKLREWRRFRRGLPGLRSHWRDISGAFKLICNGAAKLKEHETVESRGNDLYLARGRFDLEDCHHPG